MPKGKGTYGKKIGRPKKAARKRSKNKTWGGRYTRK